MGPQGLSSGRLLEPRYVTLTRVPLSRGSPDIPDATRGPHASFTGELSLLRLV